MKYRLTLFVLILSSCLAASQDHFSGNRSTNVSKERTAAADEPVQLEIENIGSSKVSETLIQRIFRETVHEVAWQLNAEHPPHILARVTLRLGASGYTLETIEGKERRTIICMKQWDEFVFARLVARAARNGLFSDQELDKHARSALARARATTSVNELQGH